MSFWRSSKRLKAASQPILPGLFSQPHNVPPVRRLATAVEHALELARARLVFVAIMFSIVYLVIGLRIVNLTLFSDPPDLLTAAAPSDTPTTSRADLIDRNGTVLATSLPTISLCANAHKMIDPDDAAKKLISVLPDLDSARLIADLHGSKHCVFIKRHLTPKQSYAINKLGIAGLEFMPDERRIYPSGNLTAHVLGYTDIDNVGLAGVEKTLNARLQQEPTPVALSLDLRLQTILHRELSEAVSEYRALAATGLIMDVTNGEILALISLPDFDPHHPGTSDTEARFNRSTLGVYEMGSTFKIFNTALALDSGLIKPSDVFDTTHAIEVGHQTIHDFHPENHALDVVEILTHSSNLGSARMAEKVGGLRQRAFLSRLGLTQKIPLELPEVGPPLVPSAANWGEATTLTVAFGHGIAVNAVQMAGAVASIVNDGIHVQPTLLKNGSNAAQAYRVVSAKTSQQVRAMLRLVVTRGTAKKADVAGYLVGGKTGTADKISGGHYMEHSRRASFIGVFPITSPRYLVLAMIDEPKATTKTFGFANAGWNAAPTVGHIISQIGPLMGISPLETEVANVSEQQLLRPLGTDVLDRLQVNIGEDYANSETDEAE